MNTLSNFDILDMMQKHKKFKGVFTKDQVIDVNKGESIVINLDDSTGPGTHWTCVFHGNFMEYFDSFGLPPPDNVLKMMKNNNQNCLFSTSQIQQADSSMCGYFCMYYILKRQEGVSIYDILYEFNQLSPLELNEDSGVLKKFFKIA